MVDEMGDPEQAITLKEYWETQDTLFNDASADTTVDLLTLPDRDASISKVKETGFMTLAACRGLDNEVFFSDDNSKLKAAKAICDDCLVKTDCLEYALEYKIQNGVWGGESERARRRMLKQRKLQSESSENQ
ncbi:WhiB family transcriptional regulator [Candidatus Saccharibacteria bacterium]|nr:WhiB family transcriptional regulator [Candidatus Saccharibacteria bacterium]